MEMEMDKEMGKIKKGRKERTYVPFTVLVNVTVPLVTPSA